MINSMLDQLIDINLGDICDSLGVRRSTFTDAIFRTPAVRFAQQMTVFNERIGAHGLRAASSWITSELAGRIDVRGIEHIPASGPLLVVSNHPGLTDTVDLFASIPRDDLRIVAAHRPFLAALPNLAPRLVFVREDAGARMSAFRSIVAELKAGRAVLTFPAGRIEPDPAQRRDAARDSLASWNESTGLLARLAPETTIVPVIVRGVFDPAAYRHPLARIKRTLPDRERMAAMLQVMLPALQNNTIRLDFGPPLHASQMAAAGDDAAAITARIRAAAGDLL
jgi:1-acyl-sn-glycerol-3-phosphate acyltransferase